MRPCVSPAIRSRSTLSTALVAPNVLPMPRSRTAKAGESFAHPAAREAAAPIMPLRSERAADEGAVTAREPRSAGIFAPLRLGSLQAASSTAETAHQSLKRRICIVDNFVVTLSCAQISKDLEFGFH